MIKTWKMFTTGAILNIFINEDRVKEALIEMEGEAIFNESRKEQIHSYTTVVNQLKNYDFSSWEIDTDDPDYDDDSVWDRVIGVIYGRNGGNRYTVLLNGDIYLSRFNLSNDIIEKAESIGFGIH